MAKTDKTMSIPTSSLRGDIPAEVMAKLQAAYQATGSSSTQGCPDPETVIAYGLEELIPEKRGHVYAHLSECKDCLDLVLDLRSAWAEAQEGKHKVRESVPIRLQLQSWLAGLFDGMRGLLPRPAPLPRLIPVAVALVVLAVGIGVLQHLKAPTIGQPPFTMTKVTPGTAYNYKVGAEGMADKVSAGAPLKGKTNYALLALLLENGDRK
jgi:hypothetical protein